MKIEKGKIIAAFGIPGSGKSTTTKEIGNILGIKTFHEPEEEEWGEAVRIREKIGNFSALMWFRATRVPQYFKAFDLRELGKSCMLDSSYDKLFHLYHDKEGVEWLFSNDDYYYDEMVSISKKDYHLLPDIDILIFFKQSEQNWHRFLSVRNRNLDNEDEFRRSFNLQSALISAANIYCQEKNCTLIMHEQKFSSPRTEAEIIAKEIENLI